MSFENPLLCYLLFSTFKRGDTPTQGTFIGYIHNLVTAIY